MKLIKLLKEKNILKYGNFKLRSGIKSNYYCDIKEVIGDPVALKELIRELVKIIPKDSTCIAGSGYGGITLASLAAYRLGLPLVLVRDKIKKYGTKKIIDGYIPSIKDRVCIIDDVFTTGSSLGDTKNKLAITKVKFSKNVVVLNRSKNSDVLSLINAEDLEI